MDPWIEVLRQNQEVVWRTTLDLLDADAQVVLDVERADARGVFTCKRFYFALRLGLETRMLAQQAGLVDN